jgi:hypothetical protein
VYEISKQTGQVLWRMGGKQDDFNLVSDHPTWQFCYQHDVRSHGAGVLSVFDNGSTEPRCRPHVARAELFAYDVNTMTVQRVTNISSRSVSPDGAGYFASALGDAQRLHNLDWLISWGMVPHITEVGPTGEVKFDMTLSFRTYRAIRRVWQADPLSLPALAARRDNGVVTAWASWNGATRVGAWQLLAGPSPSQLHRVGQVARHGFETRLRVRTSARYVAVRAIDHHGNILAKSLPRIPR